MKRCGQGCKPRPAGKHEIPVNPVRQKSCPSSHPLIRVRTMAGYTAFRPPHMATYTPAEKQPEAKTPGCAFIPAIPFFKCSEKI
ncbi:MAG: hypothetical protein B6245_21895 [Desulfobacteraceae bacterium 4572_88]|nr:MAG: hypothetical protein B6245_21895 [Desulfobacteraceae bacterium 4572_88]